jgi:hypothetical protein
VRRCADGAPIDWKVNHESGRQSSANARLAGAPGTGKSQVLLRLLAQISALDDACGFVLLDYKGDLATNSAFLSRTGARVVRPGTSPVPINPFHLPDGVDVRLAPRSFAEVLTSVVPGMGPVQTLLLTRAMESAYAEAIRKGHGYPALADVAAAVLEVYAAEGRSADSVTAGLNDLAGLGLFAERSEYDHNSLFRSRLVIDLNTLGPLRDFVAFVLVEFLHQAARGLPEARFDGAKKLRELRGIVAVDEAHYYLRRQCRPLLELIRIGRSKGVPVFLSSQSIEDFRTQTELEEFLPTTLLFRHGVSPPGRIVQGSLGLASTALGQRAAERLVTLEQFEVLTGLGDVHASDRTQGARVIPFFEDLTDPASR